MSDSENSKDTEVNEQPLDQEVVPENQSEGQDQPPPAPEEPQISVPRVEEVAPSQQKFELPDEDRAWLKNLIQTSNQGLKWFLIGTTGTLVVAVVIYVLMLGQVSSRLAEVDKMLNALTTRAVKLNFVLESFGQFNDTLIHMKEIQEALASEQQVLADKVVILNLEGPEKTRRAVAKETTKIISNLGALKSDVETQSQALSKLTTSINKLGMQLTSFDTKVSTLEALGESVDALVTLEKQQYLSVLKRQADIQQAQSGQQLPQVPRDPDIIFFSDKPNKR
jgi:CII-binding regulator of phage lambda lysogenization HflD